MTDAADALRAVAPALAFLLLGVPLAALLDRLGFFESAAAVVQGRLPDLPVVVLWAAAAATTVVLNLDTTVVLLTPLYIRMARRSGVDPVPLALVPLLLAAFASSALPVSNLTTLIAVDRLDLGVGEVVGNLVLPSLAAVVVGWLSYRRRHPRRIVAIDAGLADQRALRIGGSVVLALLVAFVAGPAFGIEPWMAVGVADLVLLLAVRTVPWRSVPAATAMVVGLVAAIVGVVVDPGLMDPVRSVGGGIGAGAAVLAGAVVANVINNIPATLLVVDGATGPSPGVWGWLIGVNVGSALLPIGALANLLWLRIAKAEGVAIGLRTYVRLVVPIALPALLAAAAVHAVATALTG